MLAYINIIRRVLKDGVLKENRTGIDTVSYSGVMFEHEMSEGFPLLTTKKVPFRLVASELEFFIKGITDKEWLKKIDNHIWDEWCSPAVIPYGTDKQTLARMKAERDLGPIYGWQWRHFGACYTSFDKEPSGAVTGLGAGIDQLKKIVTALKENPNDRRMIVSAWNPTDIDKMALPPCHYSFQLTVNNNKLNLMWNQRSVDVALGLPFNIASYALLLHLLAKEAALDEGRLVGFLGDTHIYTNHIEALNEQIKRQPKKLPVVKTDKWSSVFDWNYSDTIIENYDPHPKLNFDIAV